MPPLDFYDAELRAHHEHLRAAEAARAATPGRVVGVDLSERMLARARELTAAERLDSVRYELGDAQVHRFDAPPSTWRAEPSSACERCSRRTTAPNAASSSMRAPG